MRTTGIQTQRDGHRNYFIIADSVCNVLFTPTTPRSFGKDIRQMFLNLEECHDSFKWGLRAPLGSRSERRATNPKVKLEVGSIF